MALPKAVTVPGSDLARERTAYGVTRKALAERMGLHRNTLLNWENAPEVTVIDQRRYLLALRTLVEERTSGSVA